MTDREALMGRAQKQAFSLLTSAATGKSYKSILSLVNEKEFEETYIKLSNRIYELNCKIFDEATKPAPYIPTQKREDAPKQESKWQRCPKCGDWILKSWGEHKKCGWHE